MHSETNDESTDDTKVRDTIFRLLIEEIKDLNEAERLRGWTPWVITASLVSICWMIVQDVWTGAYNPQAVHMIFLTVSISLALVMVIRGSLRDSSASTPGKGPLLLVHTNVSALTAFVTAAWTGLIAFATYSFWQVRGRVIFAVATGWFGFASLSLLILTIMVFARFPLPVKTKSPRAIALAALVHFAIYITSLVEIFRLNLIPVTTSRDIRLGGLLALGAYGIVTLAGSGNQNPMRQTLIELRRDLILGGIPINEALQRARSALQGMWLSDVVREDMQSLLKLISDVRAEHEELFVRLLRLDKRFWRLPTLHRFLRSRS
jgi:hypothetical protein